jgi:hypothetical protein
MKHECMMGVTHMKCRAALIVPKSKRQPPACLKEFFCLADQQKFIDLHSNNIQKDFSMSLNDQSVKQLRYTYPLTQSKEIPVSYQG